MSEEKRKLKVGKDSVVMGDVSGEIGDGSVVIGPTDNRGNTIINQPMAVGRGAKAGPGSIAIGAGAGAGTNIFHLLTQLGDLPEIQRDQTLLKAIADLRSEIQASKPDRSAIRKLWEFVKASATVGGAVELIQQISAVLGS